MAVNEIEIAAPPEKVFEVLADGRRYAEWVVGAKTIRDVDGHWPAPGSKIHHTVGVGPVELRDETEVVDVDEPRRLVLLARVRPLGEARVELALEPTPTGTKVIMEEHPVRGVAETLDNPLLENAIEKRNDEALRRLKEHVEQQAAA
jgi:uncharacterized protein YndB with AHSA1/START domain